MKILQINSFYKTGSTGKLVKDLHEYYLRNGYDSYVLYGRGERFADKNVFKIASELESKIHSVLSRLFGVDFGYSFFSTNKAIRLIRKIKPDIVHVHCLNAHYINAYRLIGFLKANDIKTVITLHAEIMHTAGCEHSMDCEKWVLGCSNCTKIRGKLSHFFRDDASHCYRLMLSAFNGFEGLLVVSVSPWLKDRASKSAIMKGKIHKVVFNGVDESVFYYKNNVSLFYKERIAGKRIVFHCTSRFNNDISDLKGGHFLIEIAKVFSDILFVVAGNHKKDLVVPDNVLLVGNISDQEELSDYYSMSDLTLLTSKKETYSMVVAESLCCGTPVVGFKAGAPEMIALSDYSKFVPYGDLKALSEAISLFLEIKWDKELISNKAVETYSKETMAANYLSIYLKNE